jgi:hypothetical protein
VETSHNCRHVFVSCASFLAAARATFDYGLARRGRLGDKRLNSIWRDCDGSVGLPRSNPVGHKNLLEGASCVTARQPGSAPAASLESQPRQRWPELADVVYRVARDHGWLDGDGCHHLPATSVAVWLPATV